MVPPSLDPAKDQFIINANSTTKQMLLTLTTSIIIALTILLFTAPSPLPLGTLILLLALFSSLLIASLSSSWFGIILFLIYVGGLLVIFIYFAALCPNHFIPIKHTLTLFFTCLILLYSFLRLLLPVFTPLSLTPLPAQNTTTIFFIDNLPALLFLGLTLFLILITVVTTTKHTRGPLRPFL